MGNSSLKLLRLPQVCEKIGMSKPTIYRMLKTGDFPRPKQLSVRAVAWLESDIDDWILSREAA